MLAGLPIPIKDLTDVADVRTTQGSPIYKDRVPEHSDILVERLEENGGVVYAKSNTPEFGAGANTFNEVFGATRNPWDTSKSAAGSSGGAAVALATGMAWLAHGSDMGGSLRNPASFCGIVGLRPSIGRVAHTPHFAVDRNLGVQGPMARNVEDLALLLDAMSGEHPGDPLSLPKLPTSFLSAAWSGKRPKRVAYSPRSRHHACRSRSCRGSRDTRRNALREAGAIVEEAHPDFSEAHEMFPRAARLRFRDQQGGAAAHQARPAQAGSDLEYRGRAEAHRRPAAARAAQRTAMMERALEFFKTYDLLLCPATIVPPYAIENRYVAECDGHKFDNYVQWLGIVYAITLACCPALSLPCGFTESGLPVGLQIVGPPRGEAQLLAGAKVLEDILGLRGSTPIDPKAPKA